VAGGDRGLQRVETERAFQRLGPLEGGQATADRARSAKIRGSLTSHHSGDTPDEVDPGLRAQLMGLSQWVDRLMLTSLAALGLIILGALANQSALESVGVLLAITLFLGAFVTWIRYRRLWFALYLGRDWPGISDATAQEVAEEQSHAARQYVRARCNIWRGSKRAWLWTQPWGIRVKPRGGPQVDVKWSDMVGAQLISMNMLKASDLQYVRIRTATGLTLLFTARDIRDWRMKVLEALRANGVTLSAY
jgi:hypothetical protein